MLKNRYIEKMGEPLGTQFYALWEQVVLLHRKWAEFVELFGTKSTRIELLNQAAPAFFKMIDDVLWDDLLLHIARLTDPPKRGRLTIQSLPKLVKDDPATKKAVEELVKTAINKTNFCREPRNCLLAHTNIDLITTSTALELGSKKQTKEALNSLEGLCTRIRWLYMVW